MNLTVARVQMRLGLLGGIVPFEPAQLGRAGAIHRPVRALLRPENSAVTRRTRLRRECQAVGFSGGVVSAQTCVDALT